MKSKFFFSISLCIKEERENLGHIEKNINLEHALAEVDKKKLCTIWS